MGSVHRVCLLCRLQAIAQGPKHRKKGLLVSHDPFVSAAQLNTQSGAGVTARAALAPAAAPLQRKGPPSDKQDAAATPSEAACNPESQPSAASDTQGSPTEGTGAPEKIVESTAPVNEHNRKDDRQQPQHAALSAGVKALKPRKKDFLKRRKLKKKGLLHLLDKEPEEDLEAELMQDRHKPKFGEQAMAPLKASCPPKVPP